MRINIKKRDFFISLSDRDIQTDLDENGHLRVVIPFSEFSDPQGRIDAALQEALAANNPITVDAQWGQAEQGDTTLTITAQSYDLKDSARGVHAFLAAFEAPLTGVPLSVIWPEVSQSLSSIKKTPLEDYAAGILGKTDSAAVPKPGESQFGVAGASDEGEQGSPGIKKDTSTYKMQPIVPSPPITFGLDDGTSKAKPPRRGR